VKKGRDLPDRKILVGVDDDGFEFVLSSACRRFREQGPVLHKPHDQPLSIYPQKSEFFSFVAEEGDLEFAFVCDIGGEIEDDRLEREEAALDGLRLFEIVVFELAVHFYYLICGGKRGMFDGSSKSVSFVSALARGLSIPALIDQPGVECSFITAASLPSMKIPTLLNT